MLAVSITICFALLSACNIKSDNNKPDTFEKNENKVSKSLYNATLSDAITIDSICIVKSDREMTVFSNGLPMKIYKVALGYNPKGAKHFQGDGRTPEGLYYVNDKNPSSRFYKNLGVSYPNASDVNYARAHHKSAGGDIKIHGWPNGYTADEAKYLSPDWTVGCIAISNNEMDELFRVVGRNTPILILP